MKAGLSAYVAAPFEDYERAASMMERLRSIGFSIPVDWTHDARAALSDGKKHTDGEMFHCALEDRRGAEDADVFVLLTPASKDKGCGMWTELGFALGAGAYIVITGPQRDRNIFGLFAHQKFEHDEQVPDHLAEWVRATRVAA